MHLSVFGDRFIGSGFLFCGGFLRCCEVVLLNLPLHVSCELDLEVFWEVLPVLSTHVVEEIGPSGRLVIAPMAGVICFSMFFFNVPIPGPLMEERIITSLYVAIESWNIW